ncbi:50S ribosomal protein L13 [archaeon]|nr:MAG: 50S ribosomal protein L13 [archaeon]
MPENKETVIDADGAVLGRLASSVAKKLLNGANVTVTNIEKAIITGEPDMIYQKYKHKRERGDRNKGPFYPRQPDRLFQRVVRGMLPHRQKRGMDALRKLKIVMGKTDVAGERTSKNIDNIKSKYETLGHLSERLGANPRWKEIK